MTFAYFDRVKETSVTTGTGNLTLGGAVSGYRTFTSVYSNNDTFDYCITDQSGAAWEVGTGTFVSATPAIARTTVKASSNSGSAVNFAGSTYVFTTLPAYQLGNLTATAGITSMAPLSLNHIAGYTSATTNYFLQPPQQFSINIGNAASNTATLPFAVGPNAFIILQGWKSNDNAGQENWASPMVVLTNSTTVTASRNTSLNDQVTVYGVVIDPSSSLINSVQAGTIAIGTGASSATKTITSVATANSSVFWLGNTGDSTNAETAYMTGVTLTNATTVTANVGTTGANQVVSFVVVEWLPGVIQSLQQFSVTKTSSSLTDTQAITSVTAGNSFICYGGMTTAGTNMGFSTQVQLTNATTVTLTRGSTSATTRTNYFAVVEFKAGVLNQNVQRGQINLSQATSGTASVTAVDTTKAFANFTWWSDDSGNSTNEAKTYKNITLTNATTVTATVNTNNASGTTAYAGYEVVEFAGPASTGQPSDFNILGTANNWVKVQNFNVAPTSVTASTTNNTTSIATNAFAQNTAVAYGSGFINKFRNASMDIAQRGTSGTITSGAAAAYTMDGWLVSCTGANITWNQSGGQMNGAYWALTVTGLTSNTDILVKQRIEGAIAAPLTSKTVLVQATIINLTGGTLTPTLTVKEATAIDNWASTTTVVNGVSLQSIASGATGTLAYAYASDANANNGVEVTFDFGAQASNTKTIYFTAADIRVSPNTPVGLVSNPPPPELRPISVEMPMNQRYYYSTFGNGVTPAQNAGKTNCLTIKNPIALGDPSIYVEYPVQMRIKPGTVTTYNPSAGNANWRNITQSADVTVSVDSPATAGASGIVVATSGTVATLGDYLGIHLTATAEL